MGWALATATTLIAARGFFFPLDQLAGGDFITFREPFLRGLARGLQEHAFPLWMPEVAAGVPAAGNVEINVFFPLYQLLRWLSPLAIIKIHVLLCLFSLFWGTARWSRAWSRVLKTQYLCGVLAVFSFSVYGLLQYGHLSILSAVALLPWQMLLVHGMVESKQIRQRLFSTVCLALLMGLQWTCAHPQFHMIHGEWLFLYALAVGPSLKSTLSRRLLLLPAALLGVAVGWCQIQPLLQVMADTDRLGATDLLSDSGILSLEDLAKWVLAFAFGRPGQYWGSGDFGFGQVFSSAPLLMLCWAGRGCLPKTILLPVAFALLMALGTPIYDLHQAVIPGADIFRYPSRYLYPLLPLLALAAAHGFTGTKRPSSMLLVMGSLAMAFLLALNTLAPLAESLLPARVFERWTPLPWDASFLVPLAGIASLLLAMRRGLKSLLILPHLLFLILLAHPSLPTHPDIQNDAKGRVLVEQVGHRHNFGVETGVSTIQGYMSMLPGPFRQFLDTQAPQDWTRLTRLQVHGLSDPAAALMGVAERFDTLKDLESSAPLPHRSGGAWAYLIRDFHPLPYREASLHSETLRAHQDELQDRFIAYAPTFQPAPGWLTLEPTSWHRESASFHVAVETPALLVFSMNQAPFWRAEVNGQDTEIWSWMNCMMAVPLKSGQHTVNFSCDRSELNRSLAISGAVLVLLVLGLVLLRTPLGASRPLQIEP